MEIGGINADQIVSQLMEIEARPLNALQARQDAAKTASNAIDQIRSKVDAFRLAAERLSLTSAFDRYSTSVSNSSAISATISGSAAPGGFSFNVDQLAQAQGLRSLGTVAADSVAVVTDALLAVTSGTQPMGIGSVRVGAGLVAGKLDLNVTQSSAGAATTGTPLAASTVIDGSNNSLDVTINGVARTLTLAAGTYDAAGLTAAVGAAITATGDGALATLDASGAMSVTTTREGSAATLQITGGTALASLGLGVDGSPRVGTDGVIEVDGVATTITSAELGQAVALGAPGGTLDATLSGGLRVGSGKVAVVSTGDRSLADVAAAITSAGVGVTAAAVNVSAGAWRLQLNSTKTGVDGQIGIDQSVFTGLGGMIESSAAQNAVITIGSGLGAYQVEASGNTFTNVIPGVTLTAKEVTTAPVSVTVGRNDSAIADDAANLVTKINDLLADIKVQTRSDPVTGTKGALAGNATMRSVADQVRNALADQVSGLATSLASSVGIERDRTGSFSFDRAKFDAALTNDPDAVARLFSRGGTSTGDAVFAGATGNTVSGSYAVEVTTAATQASSAQLFNGGALADTRLGIRIGTTTAIVDVQAGESATQIIDKLNASFAQAGRNIVAESDAGGLIIRSDDWGAAGNFELNQDVLGAGTWDAQAGTDVVGTIDGIVATGIGQRLSLVNTADSKAAGLAIDIAGGVTGVLANVEYQPGIAARVVEITTGLTRANTGTLTSAKEFADSRIEDFNDQIERFEDRLFIRETNMRRQWANLQTILSGLQSQGDWLSGQLASLPRYGQ
jgi:flagellar hook-associated protein 2